MALAVKALLFLSSFARELSSGLFTELADRKYGDKTMTSKKIIERLQQLDWLIRCKTEHELALALVLNACLDAEINWTNGEPASFLPDPILQQSPVFIGRDAIFNERGLFWGDLMCFDAESSYAKDITDWFFEELRNE